MRIIGRNLKECSVELPERVNTKRACVMVHKVINDDICVSLKGHFERHAHNKTTRYNNNSINLPKITTDYARQGFFYLRVKLYSDLPTRVRTAGSRMSFVEHLDFFSENEITWSLNIGLLIFSFENVN